MALRECDKCGEMVDEAKAFCPGCGRAFVEENVREESSEFNMLDGTMQLGNTMYNQMLSDMGLNISAAPDKPAAPVQPVQPAIAAPPPHRPAQHQVLQPAVQQVLQPVVSVAAPGKKSNTWLIVGVIAIVFLVIVLIAAIAVGIFLYSKYG